MRPGSSDENPGDPKAGLSTKWHLKTGSSEPSSKGENIAKEPVSQVNQTHCFETELLVASQHLKSARG